VTQPHLDPTGDEEVFEAYAAESPPADHLPSGRARTVFLTVLTLICLLLYGVGAWGLFPPQAQWPTWLAVSGPVTALLAATCLVVTMVRAHAGAASDRPAQIAHVLLGIGWILFSWTLVTDLLLRLPLLLAGVGNPLRSRLVAVVLAVTTVALAVWGHLEARRVPRVRRVDIPIQRPSGDADGPTIGVLTDTHFDSFKTPAWSRGVVAALNALDPDVVVHAGELAGGSVAQRRAQSEALADGTRLAAAAQPENVTGTPINLTQERLVAHADVEPAKAALLSLLERARTTDQGH
jgi:hypothetical protein